MNHWKQKLEQEKMSLETMESVLFNNPELGFKEKKTRELILKYLNQHNKTIDQDFGVSGFSIKVGSGKPHIGLISEMDA